MKTFFEWTVTTVVVGVIGRLTRRAIQGGRGRVKQAIGRVEEVTARTRVVRAETESALRDPREAI